MTLAQRAKAEFNHALARCDSDDAAARLLTRFDAAMRRLGRFPELGRPGRQTGTRELVIANTPYLFIYEIEHNRVQILEIRHGSRSR